MGLVAVTIGGSARSEGQDWSQSGRPIGIRLGTFARATSSNKASNIARRLLDVLDDDHDTTDDARPVTTPAVLVQYARLRRLGLALFPALAARVSSVLRA